MKKIINLHKHIENQKNLVRLKKNQEKIDTLKRITQCSTCNLKCSMCGKYLDSEDSIKNHPGIGHGYTLCECCGEEFQEFLSIARGEKQPQVQWHNRQWKKMWSSWLRFQHSINDFINSREFGVLLEESDDEY